MSILMENMLICLIFIGFMAISLMWLALMDRAIFFLFGVSFIDKIDEFLIDKFGR